MNRNSNILMGIAGVAIGGFLMVKGISYGMYALVGGLVVIGFAVKFQEE